MAKKKGVVEKAVDKVLDVLHVPHDVENPEPQVVEDLDLEKNHYQNHPKFSKFNLQGEQKP